MEKVEILNSKLTAINDEIRELSGSEETLGLDAMAENVRGGNYEIALQKELLEQAYAELKGKVDPELYENGYAEGYDNALSKLTELEATENGEYTPQGESVGFSSVKVSVKSQSKLPQVIDRSVTEITAEDLQGATKIGNYAFQQCTKLTKMAIPNGVTSIGRSAFYYCQFESITIPNSVTFIDAYAFNFCQKLTSITIPNSIKEISQSTFARCSNLARVTIADSVTSIGATAFSGCEKLKEVTVEATTPPTIQSSTFTEVPADCAFYVPTDSVEAYKTATNWSARADYIFAIEG